MGMLDKIKEGIIGAVLPRRCPLCGGAIGRAERICSACADTITRVERPICEKCGRPVYECECHANDFQFDRCIAPFVYNSCVRRGVHRLKYSGSTETAGYLGRMMAASVRAEYALERIDVIVCVPLHSSDYASRGYNQAALLAKVVGSMLEMRVENGVLIKHRRTGAQHSLNRQERLVNVEGAFRVARPEAIYGRTVLLCDDVVTTGSTLSECAYALRQAGAKRVLCVAAAATGSAQANATKRARNSGYSI